MARVMTSPTLEVERELFASGVRHLVALDEVGRGSLAGPVTVGAVLIGAAVGDPPAGVRDSKQLSPAARGRLVEPIKSWAGAVAIGHATPAEIDAAGIMTALRWAAERAIVALPEPADAILLDGNFNYLVPAATLDGAMLDAVAATGYSCSVPVRLVVRGDSCCASIAAASIVAKVERDRLMTELAATYPEFELASNKGYASAAHLAALARSGPADCHRRSWRLPIPADGEQ